MERKIRSLPQMIFDGSVLLEYDLDCWLAKIGQFTSGGISGQDYTVIFRELL